MACVVIAELSEFGFRFDRDCDACVIGQIEGKKRENAHHVK